MRHGSVVVDGQRTRSLSTAGGIAIARVRDVDPSSPTVATDGWSFWKFVDADGEEKAVDALRARYLARGAGGGDHASRPQSARRARPGA